MKFLVIDPGVPFGWALFDGNHYPKFLGTEKQNTQDWQRKTEIASIQLQKLLEVHTPEMVYCERPTFFQGHAAAARGSFEKLCMVTGCFMRIVFVWGLRLQFIEVRDWLGQMTDVAIRHRASVILGKEFVDRIPAHAVDAVCMGLHVLGKWPHD